MQLVSCHNGRLFTTTSQSEHAVVMERAFVTGLNALDEVAPAGRFVRGAIHELLVEPAESLPRFVAMIFARASSSLSPWERVGVRGFSNHESLDFQSPLTLTLSRGERESEVSLPESHRAVVWCDSSRDLYPPAIAPFVPLDRLYLLHPKNLIEESWAVAECLRCKGVAAVVAAPGKLSRLDARRLQLAAERGGGVGILMRHFDRGANIYAAATRWLVSPCPSSRINVQKWKIQLIHGHGGRVGNTVILEHHRETNLVRATEQLVDRLVSTTTAAIRASA